jgi:hypothetical protein
MKILLVILLAALVGNAAAESVLSKRLIYDYSVLTAHPTLFSRFQVAGDMIDAGTIPLAALSSSAISSLQGSGGTPLFNAANGHVYYNGATGTSAGWTAVGTHVYPTP